METIMTTTFTLAASTDVDQLVNVDHPELRRCDQIIKDMLHAKDFGTFAAEVGSFWSEEGNSNSIVHAMYFAELGTAALSDNGSVHWTDASSIEDAERRYNDDEMSV